MSPPACNEAHAGCKELLYAAIAAAQSCGCCAARATASANFAAAVPPCAHLHAAPQPSLTPCLQFYVFCLVDFRPEMQEKRGRLIGVSKGRHNGQQPRRQS